MKNKKLLTNLLFAVVILAIAAVLLVVRRVHASGSGLRAELIYGDNNTTMNPVSYTHLTLPTKA